MSNRIESPEYIEWLENMVIMLSKDYLGLVHAANDDFLEKNRNFLPNCDDTRKAIRIITEKTDVKHIKLLPEDIEHYTKILIHNRTVN